MRSLLVTLSLVFLLAACAAAQLDDALKKAESPAHANSSSLSEDKIIAGLKEALEISTSKAIAETGRTDGFLKNEEIRILLPPKLQAVGKGMRLLGMGEQVDDLEIGMNRAAERATPQAKAIFIAALKKMTFHDAREILTGSDTAATDYFRRTSSVDLTNAFTPIVHQSLERIGVVKQYNKVIKNAPAGGAIANEFDLDQYVVEKTLDGLFMVCGAEESNIRRDPAARTTDLLREVFRKQASD